MMSKYEMTGRKEDAIIQLLKDMHYPVKITKSQLCTMGSPLSFPIIINVFVWFCNVIEYAKSIESYDLLCYEPNKTNMGINVLKLIYYEESFSNKMNNAPPSETDKLNEIIGGKLGRLFSSGLNLKHTNKSQILQDIDKLNINIDRLTNKNSIESLRCEYADRVRNNEEITETADAFRTKSKGIESLISNSKQNIASMELEIAELKKETEDDGELDDNDIEEMNAETEKQRDILLRLMDENKKERKNDSDKATQVAKKYNKLQIQCSELNRIYSNVPGLEDVNIKFGAIHIDYYKEHVEPKVEQVINSLKEERRVLENNKIQLCNNTSEVKQQLADYEINQFELEQKLEVIKKEQNLMRNNESMSILKEEVELITEKLEIEQNKTKILREKNNVNKKLRKKREQELEDENQFLIDQYRIYKKRREDALRLYKNSTMSILEKGISK